MAGDIPRNPLTPNLPIWMVIALIAAVPAVRPWGVGTGTPQVVRTTSGENPNADGAQGDSGLGDFEFENLLTLAAVEPSEPAGQGSEEPDAGTTAGTATDDPAPKKGKPKPPEKRVPPSVSCLEPLAGYFGRESRDFLLDTRSGSIIVRSDRTDKSAWPLREFVRREKNHDVRCLIAVVPSPVRSRQKHLFDVMLSAIQSAIEHNPDLDKNDPNYLFDGAWFPWTQPGSDEKRTPDEMRQPGVMLFRDTWNKTTTNDGKGVDGKGRALMVLIVGHTAKTGIDKRAFATALDLAWQISGEVPESEMPRPVDDQQSDHRITDHRVIKIVGPVFSGAQRTMENTIRDWVEARANQKSNEFAGRCWIDVVSAGAAVTPRSNELVASESSEHFDVRYRLTTTSNLDARVLKELCQHVRKLPRMGNSGDPRIAVLYDDTGYGKSFAESPLVASGSDNHGFLGFAFPSHIAEIHERDSAAQNEAIQKIPHLRGFDQTTRLPNEKTLNLDGIPEVGGEMTVVNQELRLRRMLDWLVEANVDYVAITATDNRDKLYLANLIHDNLPNVRFLMTIGDLLYLHPSSLAALQGSLVASTYQVTPPYGLADPPSQTHAPTPNLVFPIQTAQSIFNATLVQLDREQSCIGLRVDPKKKPKGWSRRFNPPESVWIGVVGADRIYPVNAINATLPIAPPEAEESTSSPETPDPFLVTKEDVARFGRRIPWNAALIAIFVAAVLFIGGFVVSASSTSCVPAVQPKLPDCHSPRDKRNLSVLISTTPLCPLAEIGEGRFHWINSRLSATAVVVSRLLIWTIIGVWGASLARLCTELSNGEVLRIPQIGFWLQSLGAALCAGFTIAEFVMGNASSPPVAQKTKQKKSNKTPRKTPVEDGGRTGIRRVGVVISLIGFGVFYYLTRGLSVDPAHSLDSLHYHWLSRTTNLWSGVSPFWPVAMLSLIALTWAIATLQSIAWRNRDRDAALETLILPLGSSTTQPGLSIAPCFLESARDPRFLASLFAAMVAVAVTTVTLWHQWLPTPDGIGFERFVLIGIALVSYAILVEILRITKSWRHLESLHNRVSELPLQAAFARFPEDFTRAFGDILFPERTRDQLSPWELQQWKTVLATLPAETQCDALKQQSIPSSRASALNLAVTLRTALESHAWPLRSSGQAFGVEKDAEGEVSGGGFDWKWVRAADDLLALTIAVSVAHYRLLIKHQALYLMVSSILLFLLIGSYPFTPERSLSTHAGLIVLLVLAAIGYIVTGMNRNEMLSRISKTHPRLLSFDAGFIKTGLVYAGPLLILLTSRMPIVRDTLGNWLGSAFSMLPM